MTYQLLLSVLDREYVEAQRANHPGVPLWWRPLDDYDADEPNEEREDDE